MSLAVDHSLDGQSRYGEIVAILVVGAALSTVVVVARAFTRFFLLHTFGADDAIMVVAQFLTIGTAVAEGLEARWGLGRHVWLFEEADSIPYMKAFYSSIVVYNVAVCLVKISILLQYRRIFAGPIMQRLTLIGLVFMTAWAVTLAFLLSLVCMPVAKFWDTSIEGGICLDNLTIWYVMAGVNLVTDFSIFSMPLPVIKKLHLPRRQRILLMGVFGLGFFTCAISIIRIQTLRVAADTEDPTYDNAPAAYWSFLELIIGVIAACLPTLRPIFVKLMPKLFGATNNLSAGRPSRAYYGSHGYPLPNNGSGGWSRGGKAPSSTHSPTTLQHSDSADELQTNIGDMGQRDSDGEYGLRDLGHVGEVERGNYRVVVSGGGKAGGAPGAAGEARRALTKTHSDGGRGGGGGFAGGIKATTMITQQVDFDDGEARRARTRLDSI